MLPTRMDLSDNFFGRDGGDVLGQFLSFSERRLTRLDLRGCAFTDPDKLFQVPSLFISFPSVSPFSNFPELASYYLFIEHARALSVSWRHCQSWT